MREHSELQKEIETPVLLACAIEGSTGIFGILGGVWTPPPPPQYATGISWKTVLIFCLHSHWNARAKGRPSVRHQLCTWTASGTVSLSVLLFLLLILLLIHITRQWMLRAVFQVSACKVTLISKSKVKFEMFTHLTQKRYMIVPYQRPDLISPTPPSLALCRQSSAQNPSVPRSSQSWRSTILMCDFRLPLRSRWHCALLGYYAASSGNF